jgi:hypothetical protein
MKRGLWVLGLCCAPFLNVVAQQPGSLARAREAYGNLDYPGAVAAAQQALQGQLSAGDQIAALEILGFAYGAMDSTRLAVETFRRLIALDPDREPDVQRVSPRITSLYASALGQVLVVRQVHVDSSTFIAGSGRVPIRFAVSRPARVVTRVSGQGFEAVVDSASYGALGLAQWTATKPDGSPVPPGGYQLTVTAYEEGKQFAYPPIRVSVRETPVDTLPHLLNLPGYTTRPESRTPPQSWRPLGLSVLYGGLAGGMALALESSALSSGSHRELTITGGAAALVGLVMSLRRPDPEPDQTAIMYNRLISEQLARRNEEIARENAVRLHQVRITVVAATGGTQ